FAHCWAWCWLTWPSATCSLPPLRCGRYWSAKVMPVKRWPDINTFSIAARDPLTGDLGVVVASKFLAVGAYVPTAKAGVGAIASQAAGNTTYGQRALAILSGGGTPSDCAAEFSASDTGIETRQFGIVAADGSSL